MECFSYKGECGIRGHMHIEMFETKVCLGLDKRLQVITDEIAFCAILD